MKNNKTCRVLVATLVTVLSFVIMMFLINDANIGMLGTGENMNWHVAGVFLTLIILALVSWLFKTCTYTITTIKNKEENYLVKLIFECLTGLGIIFALVGFCLLTVKTDGGQEFEHIMHMVRDFNMVGAPLAFISSLVTNVLVIKK
ncbi:MAG: hypothetical protein ACOQNY_00505 [Mycoplasmoidaceae bacterium]